MIERGSFETLRARAGVLAGALNRLTHRSDVPPDAPGQTLASVDASIAVLTTDIEGIRATTGQDRAQVASLSEQLSELAYPVFRGDDDALRQSDELTARIEALGRKIQRQDLAHADATRRLADVRTRRKLAERKADEGELLRRDQTLRMAGAVLDDAMVETARRLAVFIEADMAASQIAHKLRLPEGRQLRDRLLDALAHHFMSSLLPLGTAHELNITLANRHVDFHSASRRPFSPKEGA